MADTLQEFLVELGFTTKNREEFERTIKQTERRVFDFGAKVSKIGAAIAGVGIAAAKGTLAYARSLEQLNFVAQRTGTTLTRLRALQLAGASYGSSAAGAQASIEGVASFMRRNPGGSAMLLQSLGVKTTDAQGHPVDTVHLMEGIAGRFRQMKASGPMGEAIALRYADMLGISENMALAMMNPGFNGKVSQYVKAEGNAVNQAGAKAHDLMNQDRLLDAHQFGLAAEGMTPAMKALTATLRVTNEELAKLQGTDSVLNGGAQAAATIGALGVTPGRVAAGVGAWWVAKKLVGKGAAKVAGDAAAEEGTAAAGGASLLTRLAPLARVGVGAGLYLHSRSLDKGEGAELLRRRQADAVERLMQLGLTRAEAIGMAANFTRESHLLPNAVGDHGHALGIGQWHSPRRAEFTKMFGHSMRKGTLDEQLQFAAWELKHKYAAVYADMQAAGNHPRLQASIVSRGYEIPKHADTEAAKRAAIAQTINTTINVSGSGDPAQTARKVAQAQKQVNQQLARYTQGVIR